LKKTKILIIIQRSNGDVFLSTSLIKNLFEYYHSSEIDLLVNDDTYALAKLIPNINFIHKFSYSKKKNNRFIQEKNLIRALFKKYDVSINLTASDRSVIYAILAGKISISAIESNKLKAWWKKILLNNYYYFDSNKHILLNNLEPLKILKINFDKVQRAISFSNNDHLIFNKKIKDLVTNKFVIFHPSAQYNYKIYPKKNRNKLLVLLNSLDIPIVVTGGNSSIDLAIKNEIPVLKNIHNFIGETSLKEYFILSEMSMAYIGMDTLNMHIAASQNKRIFAIFGPTKLSMWSPWSNDLKTAASKNQPIQSYGRNTIFQSSIVCDICGMVGCGSHHGKNELPNNSSPEVIFKEINDWYIDSKQLHDISVKYENKTYSRKVLLYIVYGENQAYYDGAIFSLLTFSKWLSGNDRIEIIVLTEKPDKFLGYPIKLFPISKKQKNEWSLNGTYHFRIKNRGLAYVIDQLKLEDSDKILFLDTDTYFHKSPLPLFDLIESDQSVLYMNEGLIYGRKRFIAYVHSLEGKKIEIDEEYYELSKKSALWGSLMVGLTADMRPSLDWADKLLIKFLDIVPAHTIEEFALSESLLRNYKLVEGKKYVSLYSTSRKKEYASKILSKFFAENKLLDVNQQIILAQEVKIKRPLLIVLKQRFLRLFNR
jgi:heptosyltransferase III